MVKGSAIPWAYSNVHGIQVDPSKIEAISQWKIPQNAREVRSVGFSKELLILAEAKTPRRPKKSKLPSIRDQKTSCNTKSLPVL